MPAAALPNQWPSAVTRIAPTGGEHGRATGARYRASASQ
ncbi:hypothetical protein GLA29479_3311 [Lysobacter antibioticus]|nr:hypothetical protein GLA29479_3311 [Lysobacter antibioticus]